VISKTLDKGRLFVDVSYQSINQIVESIWYTKLKGWYKHHLLGLKLKNCL
jgi:hypothetical protein